MTATRPGYAAAKDIYWQAGWRGILLLAPDTKHPPPKGCTGHDGTDPSYPDMCTWAEETPGGNLALRLSDDVVGIDVDAYGTKTGATTLAEAETRWGRLPATFRSSSRDDGISGIKLFRIPAGVQLCGQIEFPELGCGDIEIVQHHHRYAMCWPSIHPEGRQYRWIAEIDDSAVDYVPAPTDLADLPERWLAALRIESHNSADLADETCDVKATLTAGRPSQKVSWRLGEALADLAEGRSRHDTILGHVLALMRYGKDGEPGVKLALTTLHAAYVTAVGPDRAGGRDEAAGEFNRMVTNTRAAQLLAEPSYTSGEDIPPPEPGDDDGPPAYAARILTRSALKALPDPEPLIDNVLDQGTTALLYGRWGTAKTFIALDWAASVATGRNWQGRPVAQRRALYIVGEGAYGFKGRFDAWETGWGTTIGDGQLDILPFPVNLTKTFDVINLAALIDWGGYSFVVLDTLARCMVGADENSAKDCGVVVDAMTGLLGHTPGGRGVVLGVHHAGKDGKTLRGSSAFEGAADTVYFSCRDGAVIVLDREKRKDGPEADRHELKINPILGTGSATISRENPVRITGSADKLMSAFFSHFAQTGATKAELRLVADMPTGSFYRALSELLEHGRLENVGTDKRPFYKLRGE